MNEPKFEAIVKKVNDDAVNDNARLEEAVKKGESVYTGLLTPISMPLQYS